MINASSSNQTHMESAPNTDTPTKRTSGSMETVQQFHDCAKPVASRVEFCVYQCSLSHLDWLCLVRKVSTSH